MKKYIILFLIIMTINSCQVDNPEPLDNTWELINSFSSKIIVEISSDDNYIYFTTLDGFYKMTSDGTIVDSTKVQYKHFGDFRVATKMYSTDFLIPELKYAYDRFGNPIAWDRVLSYYSIDDKLLYTIRVADFYEPHTYFGVLIPSDNNSLNNSRNKALIFLSQNNDATSNNFLIEYSIVKDINDQVQFSIINKFDLPTSFGSDHLIAFQDKYLLTGNNETDILTADGNFKKILNYPFREFKSIRDSVYGFQQYSIFVSNENLEQWDEISIQGFSHRRVFIIDDKFVNLGGIPEVIDIQNRQLIWLDTKGIKNIYNSDLNREQFPSTTAIKEFKGRVYLFTTTGIYSKKTEDLFNTEK
ncbi:MAG: hypothetical protein O9340_15990 [Cyclobacteriaceae bacterium]|nr:hypothetical protein [Cyclobacteriaceae bacterium]